MQGSRKRSLVIGHVEYAVEAVGNGFRLTYIESGFFKHFALYLDFWMSTQRNHTIPVARGLIAIAPGRLAGQAR
jgi:hypothetical protein